MALPALGPALPEIILAIGAIAMVLVGAIRGERATRLLEGAALALFALALVLVLSGEGRLVTFNGAFVVDGFARFMKVLTLIGAAAAILLSADALRRDGSMRFEFPILILLATIGMMMMISANDLISLYVGLELQSLALYVVAAFDRDNAKSTEAGPEIFRPRRALLRHAALRRVAGLRLHRHGDLRRHRRGDRKAAMPASA